MTNLVLAAMAAALVAGFRSFPIAFAAGIADRHRPDRARPATCTRPGVASVAAVRRDRRVDGRPRPGAAAARLLPAAAAGGRHRPDPTRSAIVAVAVDHRRRHHARCRSTWQDAFITTFAMGIVLLSIVVLTGYAGQLSLAQFALAGFGALGRRAAGRRRRLAVPAGAARRRRRAPSRSARCSPCRRCAPAASTWRSSRSASARAIELMLFNNGDLTGGFAGTVDRQADAVRLGHQRHLPPGPLRHLLHGRSSRCVVADGRQHAPRPSGPPAARRAHQRAGRRGARHQRARGQALRLRRSAGIAALGGILLAFRKDVIIYGPSSPTSRRSSSSAWRSSAASATCSARSSARRWRPGRSARSCRTPSSPASRKYIQLIGGVHRDPARAAEPGRHRQGVDRPARAGSAASVRAGCPRAARSRKRRRWSSCRPSERERGRARRRSRCAASRVRYGGVIAVDDVVAHRRARAGSPA